MTRRIPWRDADSAKTKSSPRGSPAQSGPASRPLKRVKAERDTDQGAIEGVVASSPMSKPKPKPSKLPTSKRTARLDKHQLTDEEEGTRSNSQPPEPIKENFMTDGLDKDDKYRMVEDEFLSTAGQFTAHLHKAEYQRLQDETKSSNATKIRNISRPVVGRATELVRTKQDRINRLQKQKSATRRKAESDDDDEDNGDFRNTTLFGLMESPRKKPPMLDHFTRTSTAKTLFDAQKAPRREGSSLPVASGAQVGRPRPTVGKSYASKFRDMESDEDDDDLEVAPRSRSTSFPPRANTADAKKPETATTHKAVQSVKSAQSTRKIVHTEPKPAAIQLEESSAAQESSDDDSDGALFGFQKRAKSRARQKAKSTKTGTEDQRSRRDFIPDFI